jgi:uncharacterized protein YggU (UPF0235/DUF167 family)
VHTFRAAIRVRPGSRVDRIGGAGATGGVGATGRPGELPALEVRVRARPVDGAATAAAEAVVAEALGIRVRQVRVIRGATSRDKLLEITDPPADIAQRWSALLARSD